jgi:hypothetical protein
MSAAYLHLTATETPKLGVSSACRRAMNQMALVGAADAFAARDNALAERCVR